MAETDKTDQLIGEIRELIKKLDKPKTDIRGWLTIFTSFLATVVIAGLTLFYSNKQSVRGAEERKQSFAYNQVRDSLQAEIQQANLRVAELQALRDLIPSLASKDSDTRAFAKLLLRASSEKGGYTVSSNTTDHGSSREDTVVITGISAKTSIINKFYSLLAIAGSSSEPDVKRQQALKEVVPILSSNNISASDKEKGLTIVSGIATSPATPVAIKRTAENVIANIKLVSLAELPQLITAEKLTRTITSIILHHAGVPFTTTNFKGASTIFSIAKFQTNQLNWSRISWHYAISPDGSIWLGMPLNEMAIHTKEQNKTSVGILLIMDGDKELPTEAQKKTMSALLRLLFSKLHLQAANFHPHRFYNQDNSCPGKLVDNAYLNQLIE